MKRTVGRVTGWAAIVAWTVLPAYWVFNDCAPARLVASAFFALTGCASNFAVAIAVSLGLLLFLGPLARFVPASSRLGKSLGVLDDARFPALVTAIGVGIGLWLYSLGVAPDLGRLTLAEVAAERGAFWGEVVASVDSRRAVAYDGARYYLLRDPSSEEAPATVLALADLVTEQGILAGGPIRGLVTENVPVAIGVRLRALGIRTARVKVICPRSDAGDLKKAIYFVPPIGLCLGLVILFQDVRARARRIREGRE